MRTSESITIHQESTAKQSSKVLRVIEEQKCSRTGFSRNIKALHLIVDFATVRNQDLYSELVRQETILRNVNSDTGETRQTTSRIEDLSQETSGSLSVVNNQNKFILHSTTQILSTITSGMVELGSVGRKIYDLFELCATFTCRNARVCPANVVS